VASNPTDRHPIYVRGNPDVLVYKEFSMITKNPLVEPYSPVFLSTEEKDEFRQLAKVAFPLLPARI
jgi:hypothetical protein